MSEGGDERELREGLPLRTGYTLARESKFSYACHGCNRCCWGKTIPVNPYEVARLAAHLAVDTTAFLAQHTTMGGATLVRKDDGSCEFLGPSGCTVHGARPLACRLYPLGRKRDPRGEERFAEVVPQERSEGVYGADANGTVDDFLRAQDVARHVAMADAYFVRLERMLAALQRRDDRAEVEQAATDAMYRAPSLDAENILDMDATVTSFCARLGIALPTGVEEKTALHLSALDDFVSTLA